MHRVLIPGIPSDRPKRCPPFSYSCEISATLDDSFRLATVPCRFFRLMFDVCPECSGSMGGERGPLRRRHSGKGRAVPERCCPSVPLPHSPAIHPGIGMNTAAARRLVERRRQLPARGSGRTRVPSMETRYDAQNTYRHIPNMGRKPSVRLMRPSARTGKPNWVPHVRCSTCLAKKNLKACRL
jgi:hypothetical protein